MVYANSKKCGGICREGSYVVVSVGEWWERHGLVDR